MKKISFKNLELHDVNRLSKEQLKDVMGGWSGSGGSGDSPIAVCYCPGEKEVCKDSTSCHVANGKFHCGDGVWNDC